MPRDAEARSYGSVFDEVAEDYDRHRPSYPDGLVDRACEEAQLGPGAAVLEVGCGTGQLTRSLLDRRLRVTAVEPGKQMIARARNHSRDVGDLQFINARLEEALLPPARYAAAFSASAFHWVDPDVSWRKAADALVDGGHLGLVSYFGLDDPRSAADQQALHTALATVAPELEDELAAYRDLDSILAGVAARRDNVSEAWAWLSGYPMARDYAAELFDEVRIDATPMQLEHTAEELNALLGTMSLWARLSPRQRDALVSENESLHQRLGRPIRSSTAACVVIARRRPRT